MDHLWERLEPETSEELPAEDLLHVLTCPECREWLVGYLLDLEAGDETREDVYAAAFASLERESGAAAEAAGRRRREAERLLEELLKLPPKAREKALDKERFLNLDLLELLVERSHQAQLVHPAESLTLAAVASRIAAALGESDPDAAALLSRAYCLGANALRLQHDRRGAEDRLAKAAPFLVDSGERAFYCRTAALVRWEEGRTEEALALLEHALRLFQVEGPQEDVEVCLTLKGLLLFEENRIPLALQPLNRAWRKLDRELRPVLAQRVAMALAISLAQAGHGDRARQVWGEGGKLRPLVSDERELLRIYGYEGRLLGLFGEAGEARQILAAVRRKLLAEASVGEAALVSLDLSVVLAEAGEAEEIARLSEELGRSAPRSGPMDLAIVALMSFASRVRRGEKLPWEDAAAAMVSLRRAFRAVGLRLRPLPFA